MIESDTMEVSPKGAAPLAAARRPIAAPWILGLYGLAAATFTVAANLAGWYGGAESARFLFPFAAVLGGIATFLAGMWAYEARDGLGTAMLGTWGSFWIAYGILNGLIAWGKLTQPAGAFPELGFWFIALAAITWMGAVAATAVSWALSAVFVTLGAGATIDAFAQIRGREGLSMLAGWVFILAAVCAWYAATAMMFEETFGQEMLPTGKSRATAEASRLEEPSLLRHAPAARRAG
jgi:hypothetical protein